MKKTKYKAAKQPISLVAVDLDGTLLNSQKQVSPGTAEVIRRAGEAGVHVVLASARPPRSMLAIHELLKLDTPMIAYNGALVYDPPSKRVLMHRPIPLRTARSIVTLSRMNYEQVIVSAEVLDRWYTDRVDEALMTAPGYQHQPELVAPIRKWLNVSPTKLLLLGEPMRLLKLAEQIDNRFPHQVVIMSTESFMLQVMHSTVSKTQALKTVAHELGVQREQIMAIGDNSNDACMLSWSGIGVAMANATPPCLAAADHVTRHHDDEGVAEAIEKFVLSANQ